MLHNDSKIGCRCSSTIKECDLIVIKEQTKINEVFVIIRNMSDGNESVGEMWNETKIFKGAATLSEVMDWAMLRNYDGQSRQIYNRHSQKNIIITKPHITEE